MQGILLHARIANNLKGAARLGTGAVNVDKAKKEAAAHVDKAKKEAVAHVDKAKELLKAAVIICKEAALQGSRAQS